jgi:5-methyltetrahydropteroyltriglutamate--homocysteine methyltransferase
MKRSTDRVLTTHVGSLLKPPEVLAFIQAKADGQPIDEHAFTQTLRTAVDEVVRQQAAAGVDVPSDGEFGKSAWTNYVVERMSGFELRTVPRPPVTFLGAEAEGRFAGYYEQMSLQNLGRPRLETSIRMVCTGPIAYTGKAIMQRDVDNFRAALEHVQVEEAFLPVVAPASIAVDHANEFYPSEEAYLFAVAEALHEEYQTIVDAGLIVQVDDAILTNMYDAVVASGQDYRHWVQMRLEALNHGLRGIPEDRVRYHLCWGSWPGPHTSDVPLREIVDLLLQINAQGYSIEAANPRHEHEWTVWRDVKLPDGKILLPGVVSHAISHVEHPELIAQRITRYADLVGRENVIASTDCGFSQNFRVQRQHPTVVWAKLEAMAEGARLASRQLAMAAS